MLPDNNALLSLLPEVETNNRVVASYTFGLKAVANAAPATTTSITATMICHRFRMTRM